MISSTLQDKFKKSIERRTSSITASSSQSETASATLDAVRPVCSFTSAWELSSSCWLWQMSALSMCSSSDSLCSLSALWSPPCVSVSMLFCVFHVSFYSCVILLLLTISADRGLLCRFSNLTVSHSVRARMDRESLCPTSKCLKSNEQCNQNHQYGWLWLRG